MGIFNVRRGQVVTCFIYCIFTQSINVSQNNGLCVCSVLLPHDVLWLFFLLNAAEIHIIFNKINVFYSLDYRLWADPEKYSNVWQLAPSHHVIQYTDSVLSISDLIWLYNWGQAGSESNGFYYINGCFFLKWIGINILPETRWSSGEWTEKMPFILLKAFWTKTDRKSWNSTLWDHYDAWTKITPDLPLVLLMYWRGHTLNTHESETDRIMKLNLHEERELRKTSQVKNGNTVRLNFALLLVMSQSSQGI